MDLELNSPHYQYAKDSLKAPERQITNNPESNTSSK
jgi:hypothetical protein